LNIERVTVVRLMVMRLKEDRMRVVRKKGLKVTRIEWSSSSSSVLTLLGRTASYDQRFIAFSGCIINALW
jgi:hypothetical protein